MPFQDDLFDHLSASETAPFLFVGSGMSRRFLGTEDWDGLLRRFAAHTNYQYERYRSDADGDPARTASGIAARFKDVWWDSPDFAASRDSFPNPQNAESPLKIEIAQYLDEALSNLPNSGPEFDELEILRSAQAIEGIITTNYDGLLESLFPDYAVYAGEDQLLFNASYGVGEIFKIHGSTGTPETLVLTARDYERFNERNQYLAAKLLTIFVEHPVVFLGYSLSDPNIQQILRSLGTVLTSENLHRLQDRLIFVQWMPVPVASTVTRTVHLVDGHPIPIISIEVNDFLDTFAALARLQARLPAPILHRVKEQIYDLVSTGKSKGTLQVRDIDDDVDPDQVEIVIGIGIKRKLALEGLVGWDRMDVIREVLDGVLQGNKEALERVARDVLPQALSGGANTPIYYYLNGAERLDSHGNLSVNGGLHDRVKLRAAAGMGPFRMPASMPKKYLEMAAKYLSFEELVAGEDAATVLLVIQVMEPAKIDPHKLRVFLIGHTEVTHEGKPTTNWTKAVCVYDALQFGPLR